jgi:hypothetical protein
MPQEASALSADLFLNVLLMGVPRIGKTTSTIVSLANAFGKGYVVCCGLKSGMLEAQKKTTKFSFDVVRYEDDMEAVLKEARDGVKSGAYKWVFVDDFSLFASMLHDQLRAASAGQSAKGEADGRRYYPELKKRLLNTVRRFLDLKTHVIVATHWMSPSGEIDGQKAKVGVGIVPLIPGAAREELPTLFPYILWLEKEDKTDRRVFRVNPEGVWGPGCYNISGTHTIDADFLAFAKLLKSGSLEKGKGK